MTKDRDFYSTIGGKGGRKTAERGKSFFSEIGTKGGNAVLKAKGKGFYSQIGKMSPKRIQRP